MKLIGYFDFLCPYCYLGTTYAKKMQQEVPCDIEWHPISLHPNLPAEGKSVLDGLSHVTNLKERTERLRALGEKVSLPVVENDWLPNTQKALEALEFARDFGKADFFMFTVFNASFGAGINISQEENILKLAAAVGLDSEGLQEAWLNQKYHERMATYIKEAQAVQLDVVPTLVKEGKKVLEATTTMDFTEYRNLFLKIGSI